MSGLPLPPVFALAAILFCLGVGGLLLRRSLLFILIAIEVMLNAAALAFVAAGAHWGQADGQVMFLFILAMAAAEVAVGLGMVLILQRRRGTLDADVASRMRG